MRSNARVGCRQYLLGHTTRVSVMPEKRVRTHIQSPDSALRPRGGTIRVGNSEHHVCSRARGDGAVVVRALRVLAVRRRSRRGRLVSSQDL